MKHLIILLFLAITSCADVTPVHPEATRSGNFRVEELDANRKTIAIYRTKKYAHTYFPRTISFTDSQGKPVVLTKNFEVYLEK